MICCIFRCGVCGQEGAGYYFGQYRWGLPNGWLIYTYMDAQVATCSTVCQEKAATQLADQTVPINVSRPESKEIVVEIPVDDSVETAFDVDEKWPTPPRR